MRFQIRPRRARKTFQKPQREIAAIVNGRDDFYPELLHRKLRMLQYYYKKRLAKLSGGFIKIKIF
jgi:hypothetical protein